VNFLGDVGVPVEHEASRVRVGTEVLKDEPLVFLNPLELGVAQRADLVKTVTGRTENSSGDLLTMLLVAIQLLKAGS